MSPRTIPSAVVHVRLAGRSFDVPLAPLELGPGPSDAALKQAIAQWLDVPWKQLRDHAVDRHANGNLTIRPQAVFG